MRKELQFKITRTEVGAGILNREEFMSKKIHVIDDSEDVHYILERYLSKEGIGIFSSYNGKEALEFLDDKDSQNLDGFPPETILLDVNMPILNGFEFLEQFSVHPMAKKASVIMLTSSTLEADKEKASKYPFVKGYIAKPILKDKVLEILRIV